MDKDNPYILMVDDSVIISQRLAALLYDTGVSWRMAWARNYAEVMDSLAAGADIPAVVVLDINLPGKSGIDVLRHIKAMHPTIIVVMLTNQASDYYRELARGLGADYFLDKSNDFEQLPGLLYHLVYP